jgi:cytochrome c peroxidase
MTLKNFLAESLIRPPMNKKNNSYLALCFAFGFASLSISKITHANEGFGPLPTSLKGIQPPAIPGLVDGPLPIIINKEKAIVLGKALFWDTNVGSDGMACGSCHFHAGADSRTKNQIHPGGKSTPVTDLIFDTTISGHHLSSNYQLQQSDFPFHQRENPVSELSPVIFNSDDVVSSSGTFGGEFEKVERSDSDNDQCARAADSIFHVNSVGTRRIEPRNTPTIINSIYNHRNFWDGRANNIFNGSSPWGDRDPYAGIWVKKNSRTVKKQRLNLPNSSIASLSMAPPKSDTEMSCANRTLPHIGRKLISRQPLENQKVHWNDSVLGSLSLSTEDNLQPGLNTTYADLIKQSFHDKYWSFRRRGNFGQPVGEIAFNQMEANFSMFFGLSIQMYISTLISDESPFDLSERDQNGLPIDLTDQELNGLKEFRRAHCTLCHIGPTFSSASVATNAEVVKTQPEAFGNEQFTISTTTNVITRQHITSTLASLNDTGYASTGVTRPEDDIGLGGTDDFGNPLSFSKQYLQLLAGNSLEVKDPQVLDIRPCDFQVPLTLNANIDNPHYFTLLDGIFPQNQDTSSCFKSIGAFLPEPEVAAQELQKPDSKKMLAAMDGSFKIPGLRNIELTGPYMHNGGMATLEQVIEFYTRAGNFVPFSLNTAFIFEQADLRFNPEKRSDIVAFLKTLTDDRVRFKKAPFDHPEIKIPHGHVGDDISVENGHSLGADLAKDELLIIDAVGANGIEQPIEPFVNYLAP